MTDATNEVATLLDRITFDKAEVAERLGCHLSTLYRWQRGESRPKRIVLNELRKMAQPGSLNRPLHAYDFTFIDLFAGIGGMRLAAEALNGKCLYTCEWDKYARMTYQANFADGSDHPFEGDIRTVNPASIPAHDLLIAGFPCQPFSIAGVSKKNALGRPHGFDCEEQGNLFFYLADILGFHRPPAFLLENVKNLKSHNGGHTFATIRSILEDRLGYEVHTRVIDAKSLVPQHRERIFIVGFRKSTSFDFDKLALPDPSEGPKLSSILHSHTEIEEPPYTLSMPQGGVIVNEKYTLTAHLWKYLQNYAEKHRAAGHGFGYGLVEAGDVARTLSARYYKDGSEILVSQGRNKRPRRLTPRECARLMGFDRPGRKRFEIPVSDTRAYKQFGNAVVVPVVETVIRHLLPTLEQVRDGEQLPFEVPTTPGAQPYA